MKVISNQPKSDFGLLLKFIGMGSSLTFFTLGRERWWDFLFLF